MSDWRGERGNPQEDWEPWSPSHSRYMMQSGLLDSSGSMCEICVDRMDDRKDQGPWRLFFRGEKWFYWDSSQIDEHVLSVFIHICRYLMWTQSIEIGRWEDSCHRNVSCPPHLGLHGRQANTKQFPTKLPAGVRRGDGRDVQADRGRPQFRAPPLPRQSHRPLASRPPCCDWHGRDETAPDHEGGIKQPWGQRAELRAALRFLKFYSNKSYQERRRRFAWRRGNAIYLITCLGRLMVILTPGL